MARSWRLILASNQRAKNENAAKNECRGGASFSIGTVSAGTEVDERMMSTDQLMKLEEEP
jgi:hypothetical protein